MQVLLLRGEIAALRDALGDLSPRERRMADAEASSLASARAVLQDAALTPTAVALTVPLGLSPAASPRLVTSLDAILSDHESCDSGCNLQEADAPPLALHEVSLRSARPLTATLGVHAAASRAHASATRAHERLWSAPAAAAAAVGPLGLHSCIPRTRFPHDPRTCRAAPFPRPWIQPAAYSTDMERILKRGHHTPSTSRTPGQTSLRGTPHRMQQPKTTTPRSTAGAGVYLPASLKASSVESDALSKHRLSSTQPLLPAGYVALSVTAAAAIGSAAPTRATNHQDELSPRDLSPSLEMHECASPLPAKVAPALVNPVPPSWEQWRHERRVDGAEAMAERARAARARRPAGWHSASAVQTR